MENQEEEIKKASFPERPWKVFFWEAFLFSFTLFLGIISAFRINQISQTLKIEKIPVKPTTLLEFILSFLFASLTVFLIIKFLKFQATKRILFKALFILAVFSGGALFLELWFGTIFALFLISILTLFWLKGPDILIHDLLLIMGMAGIGSVFGWRLDPLMIIILLSVFSVYDVIAVYLTKHMVKMAKGMIEAGAMPGIILPTRISEFKTPLKDIKMGGKFLILGGGDIVFPLLLCSSLASQGILNSIIVALFALIGLSFSFFIFISQKTRQAIPALPPIALFSIIGYLITKIL